MRLGYCCAGLPPIAGMSRQLWGWGCVCGGVPEPHASFQAIEKAGYAVLLGVLLVTAQKQRVVVLRLFVVLQAIAWGCFVLIARL